jgi:hypothetical protein
LDRHRADGAAEPAAWATALAPESDPDADQPRGAGPACRSAPGRSGCGRAAATTVENKITRVVTRDQGHKLRMVIAIEKKRMWQPLYEPPFVLSPKHAVVFGMAAGMLADIVGWEPWEVVWPGIGVTVFDDLSHHQ